MALVKCPDCGKMVSPRAVACPDCGCPKEFFEEAVSKAEIDPVENLEQTEKKNSEINIKASNEEIEAAAKKIEDIIEKYVAANPGTNKEQLLCEFIKKHTGKELSFVSNEREYVADTEDLAGDDSVLRYIIVGNTMEIPVEVQNERYISRKLASSIAKVGPEFDKGYSKLSDCNSVLKNSAEIALETLYPVMQSCVDVLNEQGIYTMDTTSFVEKYCKGYLDEYRGVIKAIEDQLKAIDNQQESERRYREARKDSRGRVVGGGFGLGGAIKGMATAGAINAATGMAHSLGNAIGNAGSGATASASKSQLYKNAQKPMKDALISAAYKLKSGLRDILRRELGILCKYVTKEEASQAEAIVNNIIQGRIPKESERTQLLNALILNPYDIDTYEQIWDMYGDANLELRKMAAYFEVPLSGRIQSIACEYGKKVYEEKCRKYINAFNKISALVSCESNFKEVVEILIAYCKERTIEESLIPEIEKCRALLLEVDIELRKVNGVVYESKTIAEKVKADYQQFYTLLSNKNVKEEGIYEMLSNYRFLSEEFKEILPELYEKECLLRTPERILENIYEIVQKYSQKGLLGGTQIIIPKHLGDYTQKEQNVKLVTSMPTDEVPLIMFERSSLNKSAVLITNKYVRSFSKLLFVHENNMYEMEKINSIQCVEPEKYNIHCVNSEDAGIMLKVKKETAEVQVAIGEMMTEIIFVINNLTTEDRNNLYQILYKTETVVGKVVTTTSEEQANYIFCTSCGKKILRTAKFCNFCGTKNNDKG